MVGSWALARGAPHYIVLQFSMKYFPTAKAILVNADGGSSDGTKDEVKKIQKENVKTTLLSYPVHPDHKVVAPYPGIPGKGTALRTVFEIVESLSV